MNVLCIIYGIGRGVETSSATINKNIIKPLSDLDIKVETIYVLNELDFIENKRSGDYGAIKSVPKNIFINEERILCTKEQLLDQKVFKYVKNVKDVHNDNYKSYENLLCQLGMLKEACKRKDFFSFDRILMVRDDLIISTSNLDFLCLLNVSSHGPITSMWHWHGGIGERFILCMPELAVKLACKINEVKNFVSDNGYLNGEHLQRYVLEKEKEKIMAINLKLVRVRLNFLVKENFYLPFWRPYELLRVFFAVFRYNFRKILFYFSKN